MQTHRPPIPKVGQYTLASDAVLSLNIHSIQWQSPVSSMEASCRQVRCILGLLLLALVAICHYFIR